MYDAMYAYCQEMVRRGKTDGAFKGAWALFPLNGAGSKSMMGAPREGNIRRTSA